MVRFLTGLELGRDFYGDSVQRAALRRCRPIHPGERNNAHGSAARRVPRPPRPAPLGAMPGGIRLAVTPGEMWEFFKEKRVQYRLSLLPLNAEDFVGRSGAPNDVELNLLFEQNRSTPYDPASEKYGPAQPNRTRVAWISLDAVAGLSRVLDGGDRAGNLTLPRPQLAAGRFLAPTCQDRGGDQHFERQRFPYRIAGLTEAGAAACRWPSPRFDDRRALPRFWWPAGPVLAMRRSPRFPVDCRCRCCAGKTSSTRRQSNSSKIACRSMPRCQG